MIRYGTNITHAYFTSFPLDEYVHKRHQCNIDKQVSVEMFRISRKNGVISFEHRGQLGLNSDSKILLS